MERETSLRVIVSKSDSQLVFSVHSHECYKQFRFPTCLSLNIEMSIRPIHDSVYVCTNTRNMFTHKTINKNKLSC